MISLRDFEMIKWIMDQPACKEIFNDVMTIIDNWMKLEEKTLELYFICEGTQKSLAIIEYVCREIVNKKLPIKTTRQYPIKTFQVGSILYVYKLILNQKWTSSRLVWQYKKPTEKYWTNFSYTESCTIEEFFQNYLVYSECYQFTLPNSSITGSFIDYEVVIDNITYSLRSGVSRVGAGILVYTIYESEFYFLLGLEIRSHKKQLASFGGFQSIYDKGDIIETAIRESCEESLECFATKKKLQEHFKNKKYEDLNDNCFTYELPPLSKTEREKICEQFQQNRRRTKNRSEREMKCLYWFSGTQLSQMERDWLVLPDHTSCKLRHFISTKIQKFLSTRTKLT